MLAIAAARRLRSMERAGLARSEDADYWKTVAPSAICKAHDWRMMEAFRTLPG